MGAKRMPSQSCTNSKARLQNTVESTNRIVSYTNPSKRLCRPTKTEISVGLCSGNASEKRHCTSKNECTSGILQQVVFSPEAREKMEASDRLKCIKSASIGSHIQDGDYRSYTKLHLQREVGRISRSNRHILPHSYPPKIAKSASISCGRTFVPIQSPTFQYSHGSTRIHSNCQGGKANASKQGYTHPPVLRPLVTASSNSTDLHGAVKTAGRVCTRTRLGNQLQKIRVNSNPKFRFSGVQIRLDQGRGPTHTEKMANFDNCH